MITDATITTTALLCSSLHVGQVTLFTSSSVVSLIYALNLLIISRYCVSGIEYQDYPDLAFQPETFLTYSCTGGEIRTPIKGFGDLYSTLELHLFV